MTEQNTTTERPSDRFARLIAEMDTAANAAGYAAAQFIHDRYTDEAELREKMRVANDLLTERRSAMWEEFYRNVAPAISTAHGNV